MQKKLISILSLLMLVILLMTTLLTSCGEDIAANILESVEESNNPQNLQILSTGNTLTQEQMLSQIKAEHLKENKGYLDSDKIIALVQLPGKSVIDVYLDGDTEEISVAAFAASDAGKALIAEIEKEQADLIEALMDEGLIEEVTNTYSTVMNAVAVSTTYGDFKEIEEMDGIENTLISETYNRPMTTEGTDASAIINAVGIYEDTGIFDSSSVVFKGAGTAVAILDSGFDCSHSVFANMPDGTVLIETSDVEAILAESEALRLDSSVDITKVYVNKKIPFAFDYADKDTNVNPYDSEHGTHVAGIIGGKDDVITGVAVDTQLVLMKVFPDLDDGGRTEDILAALEDSILLGVDAINMSLGSSCGFSREEDGDKINEVYDHINEAGISLITAASNSYSAAFGGEQGNTNKVTNPDSGTVGSPSTYPTCLSVASISGTMSRYLIANDEKVIFFSESNDITGDPNDFFKELGVTEDNPLELEYVTIPGVGMKANYNGIDVKGKVALVARGTTTFEDKALQAKNAGAIACIIYNNIEGDILMSMGKTDHIPTISISKDLGTALASRATGTLSMKATQQAGPFMSDFSSWGPTPDLKLKPEITAHGGNIKSAIPGGGYDELSGTSMATPNLCGIVVLIRQYLKEKYPTYTYKQISILCNQLLMSTATIILNEQGNPYSPRKQGAGLASLYNVVNSGAYITVDGIDRSKLELGDDAERTGVYEMQFNVENIADKALSYNVGIIGMTESVSTSDDDFVAEKSYMLDGNYTVEVVGGSYSRATNTVTVEAGKTATVKVVYTISDADKAYIDASFPYGMYVEGFVTLEAVPENEEDKVIDLNVPFLSFYGDWTQAPMFDKTYYEVESEAHNNAIDDEDKLKADYYATTPYGSYFYNYIIPLGTYLYDIDEVQYEVIPASEDHIAISDALGTIDGISAVYAGLLRNAKTMTYTITDKVTGEVIKELVVENARKAYSNGASPVPNYEYLRWKTADANFVNNRQYEFKMVGVLDYGDGGVETNVRNSFSFDFYVDTEAPVIKSAEYEKEYDKTLKKDRYYLTLTVYDNHYVQSIMPIAFTSNSSYTTLTDNPIPVYSQRGKDTVVRFEITSFLDDLYSGALSTSALGFAIDDYALNSDIYFCQLPGTRGDFKFTKDGEMDGIEMTVLSLYEDEVIDLTQYLATSDDTVDADKDYLKYLSWSSMNEKVAVVKEGQIRGMAAGRTTIIVQEAFELKQAALLVIVKERESTAALEEACEAETYAAAPRSGENIQVMSANDVPDASDANIKSIRFSYFDTLFAYSRAAQTSKIGETGDRWYLSSFSGGVSFYPGEKIQLFYDLDPWYTADKYEVTFSSTNPKVATVDENGVVTGLKKGTTSIILRVAGSSITTSLRININSEFVIENRTLVAYKGLGGEVVIPDDEGILYIGAFAFCLYDTDNSFELDEDDYDANKIPNANTSVTKVVIPDGITDIQKYAFYNCSALREVVIPDSVKYVREYAFYKNAKLTTINLGKVETIGAHAFDGCASLETADLSRVLAMGARAFNDCVKLQTADLSMLRTTGKEVFKNCTALESVTMVKATALGEGMFVQSGLKTVDIYTTLRIPEFAFAQCKNLTTVNIHNDFVAIDKGAFCQNPLLENVHINGSVGLIGEQAFYDCDALATMTLPNCAFSFGAYAFFECSALETLVFDKETKIASISGAVFDTTALATFTVDPENTAYAVSADGHLLLDDTGKVIILAAVGHDFGDYVLDSAYTTIGDGAFSGVNITSLTITNNEMVIGNYAFTNCDTLTTVNLPETAGVVIGDYAFRYATALTTVNNLDQITSVGMYAFANTDALKTVVLGADATYGEGAFYLGGVEHVTIGANTNLGGGAFRECSALTTVVMPAAGGVHIGQACFAFDTKLSEIDLSLTDDTIDKEAFFGCTALSTANLANVKKIGAYAFADCAVLYTVKVPVVEVIGEGAFSRNTQSGAAPSMAEIELPDTLTTIEMGAFLGCAGLDVVTLPAGVTRIEKYTFSYCTALTDLVSKGEITYIGEYSFVGCKVLTDIDLSHVTEVGDYAFYQCEYLTNIDLTSAVKLGEAAFASTPVSGVIDAPALTTLGDYAFQKDTTIGGSLLMLKAPLLTHIGEAALRNNKNLTGFVFSRDITEIGVLAFDGCTSLETFSIAVEEGDPVTTGTSANGYARLADGVLYTKMPSGAYQLTSVPAAMKLETLIVEEGTTRIEHYAGNSGNDNVKTIILPSTLKLIGDHAFYGYDNLTLVEFRSFVAPAWENFYDNRLSLETTDPGYDLLHNQFHLTTYELCYCNFIDLIGKFKPITMKLPANPDVQGYDAITYLAAFGSVEDAERSEQAAMDTTLTDFITYAEEIKLLDEVTLANETLINNAATKLNALKQSGTDFGYTQEEWDALVACVKTAMEELRLLKLAAASQTARDLQEMINALPDTYTADTRAAMDAVEETLERIDRTERAILDLTRYNALRDAYEADKAADKETDEPTTPDAPTDTTPDDGEIPDDEDGGLPDWATLLIALGLSIVAGGVTALIMIIIRKKKGKE